MELIYEPIKHTKSFNARHWTFYKIGTTKWMENIYTHEKVKMK